MIPAWDDPAPMSETDLRWLVKQMRAKERPIHKAHWAGQQGYAWSELNWPPARLEECRMAWEYGQAERRFVRWWRFRVKTYKTMWQIGRAVAPKTTRRFRRWRQQRV